jgi:muramoyltetrapeptide carboxypeptidase
MIKLLYQKITKIGEFMNIIKPQILSKGDTIEIIAPAGAVDYDLVIKSKDYIESKGYKVVFGEHIFEQERYFAGCDKHRLEDFHNAFLNPEVKAIFCARGGYGSIRFIEDINYNIVQSNPKIFCGYSDITALSLMILKHAGLITYSSPMMQSDFSDDVPNEYTEKSFFNVLSGNNEEYLSDKIINHGNTEGIIWGGNLSTVVSLCGLDFIPDEKFIFFTEDVNEPVYKIDKMLRQLINIEKFRQNISALAFGEFSGVDNPQWLEDLLSETSTLLNVPTASGFKFTHSNEKQTIPIGQKAIFDGNIKLK